MAWREWYLLLVLTIVCRGTARQECPPLGLAAAGSLFREANDNSNVVLLESPILYLYTTLLDSQCTGNISEVEFCYQEGTVTDRLFSVVILEVEQTVPGNSMSLMYRVVARSDVSPNPAVDNCSSLRCCTTRRLDPVIVVSNNNVYGIETASTNNILYAFNDSVRPGLTIDIVPGVSANLNDTVMQGSPNIDDIEVAVVRFIAINRETATPLPVTSSPPTVIPRASSPRPTPTLFPTRGGTGPTSTPPAAAASSERTAPREATSTRIQPQPSTVPPVEQSGGFDPVPVGIGVAVGFLVAIIVVIVAVIVAVMVVQRRRKRKDAYSVQPSQGEGFTNAIYTAAGSDGDIIELNAKVGRPNPKSSDPKKEPEPPHEYAMPDEIRGAKVLDGPHEYSYATTEATKDKIATVPNEYSYATTEVMGTKQPSLRSMSREEVIYEVPAKDENSLYAQFEKIRVKQIQRSTVKTTDHLGSGQFGTVTKGEWESPNGPLEVAIKTLKTDAAQTDKVKFLQEAAIMGQFQHNNVVKLYGVVLSGKPVMIVLELLAKGDLREHLISLCPELGKEVQYLEHTLLSFCRQIAFGMDYLSRKAFVHRDLAARNILVAEDDTCKVADFGMSRDLVDENYYISSGGKIPVKWTAPEAIHFKKYSTASDVWSFGAVMYEIWSLGHKPFEGYTNQQAIKLIEGGFRLPPPPGCPKAIYQLMINCWHQKTSERPNFTTIVQWLSRPDPQLLKWSEEDRAVHPEASKLGAEFEAAVELYKELQGTYTVDSADQDLVVSV